MYSAYISFINKSISLITNYNTNNKALIRNIKIQSSEFSFCCCCCSSSIQFNI